MSGRKQRPGAGIRRKSDIWRWRVLGWAIWLALAAVAMPSLSRAAEPPQVEERIVRQPTLRKIRADRDGAALERIEHCRARLPAQYRERNNFAWAVVGAKDLDKTEYFAHSGIQSLDGYSSPMAKQLEGISLKPENGRYHVLCVNQHDVVDGSNCWVRSVDTEYKIIEDLVARLPDTSIRMRVKLYTDLPPCASCWNVLKQFMAEYENARVQVLHR